MNRTLTRITRTQPQPLNIQKLVQGKKKILSTTDRMLKNFNISL